MTESSEKLQLGDVQQSATCGICLQLLSDPRGLNCGHTFCLACLRTLQTSMMIKECPMCRAQTVPGRDDLERLPTNRLAVDLVKLVHAYNPSTQEVPNDWSAKAITENFSTLSMVNLRDGVRELRYKHNGVLCNHCKQQITGARFKCGICDDYDLCGECETLTRHLVHDTSHIFIKLKRPRSTLPAFRRSLHKDCTLMRTNQDQSKHEHVYKRDDAKDILFICDNCDVKPIVGTRYKCGVCDDYNLCEECEKTSEKIHNPKHIFLVLKHPVRFLSSIPLLTYDFYGNPVPRGGSRSSHEDIVCDGCGEKPITGSRYKCGLCEDFDLCEGCFHKPRSAVHDVTHIFIKLKRPRKSPATYTPVLHQDSTAVGQTQNTTQSNHMTTRCNNCGMNPIIGTRFKCGGCADYNLCENCEQTSERVHNSRHIFLVLKHPVGFVTKVPQVTYNFYD